MKKLLSLLLFLQVIALSADAQNQNISGGLVFEGEPYLAVNPANPQHLVVAWMGYLFGQPLSIKTKASFDGGHTWSPAKPLPHLGAQWHSADPSLAFGADGAVYACYIDYRESPDSGAVYVVRSPDGGLSWGAPHPAIDVYADGAKLPIDRPWLVIDRSSGAHKGNLYITTKPAPWIPAPNRPYFVRSTDGGITWSPFRFVDTTGFLVGNFIQAPMAVPAVSATGTLHIVYPSWVPAQNLLPGFYLASSTDGGATFQRKPVYFANGSSGDTLAKSGYRLFANPANPNHLALVFPYKPAGDIDVYLLETQNGGASWSAPVRVNDDPAGNGKMQDLVWGDFDADGDLVLAWRDRRNAPGTGYATATETWAAVRWKDSTAFSPNFRISDVAVPYSAVLAENGNDFMGVQLVQDTLLAVWGDVRSGHLNIWFEKRSARTQMSTGLHAVTDEPVPEVRIIPNPTRGQATVEGEAVLETTVFNQQGAEILRTRGKTIDLRAFPPGTYVAWIKTSLGNVSTQVVKQ